MTIRRDEKGAALVIALVMIFLITLIAIGVMSYASTSLKASSSIRTDRESLYAADGAIDAAIQRIRTSGPSGYPATLGYIDSANPCAFDLPAQGNQPAAHVECTDPVTYTTSPGDGGIGSNAPKYAILTLGRNANQPGFYNWNFTSLPPWGQIAEAGVFFQPSITGTLNVKHTDDVNVRGGIFSNSTIALNTGASINASGAVQTRQPCGVSGGGAITPACSVVPGGYSDNSVGQDPNYPHRGQLPGTVTDANGTVVGGFPSLRTVPACGTSAIVEFEPGWYDDAEALNDLFRTCANADATGKNFWFKPGTYYFDFRNASVTQDCGAGIDHFWQGDNLGAGGIAHQWCIRGKNVNNDGARANRPHIIGGTPLGWNQISNPISLVLNPASATGPDFTDVDNAKTFGDDTSATTSFSSTSTTQAMNAAASTNVSGTADFAPTANATGPANGTVSSHTLTSAASSTVPTTATGAAFVNPQDGRVIDGTSATSSGSRSQSLGNAANASGNFNSGNQGNARVIEDNNVATYQPCIQVIWWICGGAGSVTVNNFANKIPSTATPTAAVLEVRHRETIPSNAKTLRAEVLDGSANVLCSVNVTPSSTLTTQTFNLPAACLNTAAKVNAAQVRYTVDRNTNNGVVFALDGVRLTVDYTDTSARTLVLGSFTPPIGDAANTAIDAAVLTIAHSETAGAAQSLTIQPGGGGTACAPVALPQRATLTNDVVDVKASGCLDSAAKLNGATVTYGAAPGAATTVAVDGVKIDVGATNTATRRLTMSSPAPPVPATGSAIDGATLSIAHQETGADANPRLVVTAGGGGTCTLPLTARANLTIDTFDVKASGCLDTAAKLNGATYAYQVNLTANGAAQSATVAVDAVSVEVSTTSTASRALTLGAFAPAVPPDTSVTSATLEVAHRESAGTNPRLVVSDGTGTQTYPLTARETMTTDAVDVTLFVSGGAKVNAMTVAYTVNVNGGPTTATAAVDGVRLNLTHTPPPDVPDLPNGSCDNTKPGVQWIFGGDSRVYMPDAMVELCAGPAPGQPGDTNYTAQQIAVYGLRPTPPSVPSAVISNPGAYTNPDGALVVGESPTMSTATTPAWFLWNRSITLGNFNAIAVPPGLKVTKVTARVSHGESNPFSGNPSLILNVPGNGSACNYGVNNLWQWPGTWLVATSTDVDVTGCFPASMLGTGGTGATLDPGTATFTAPSDAGTEYFDGLELRVELGPVSASTPVFVPQNGCVTRWPNYWDGFSQPDCALWKWDSVEIPGWQSQLFFGRPMGQPNGQLSVQGTVYAPGAALDVDDQGVRTGYSTYSGVNYPIFNRGIIARHVRFKAFKGAPDFTGGIIACGGTDCAGGEVPNPRTVTLTAYTCPDGAATCDADTGRRRVTAQVTFPLGTDPPPVVDAWTAT